MAVYFFYGDEDYNIELEIERMRSKLNPDFVSMSFQTLDNPEYTELITALRTPPMMFGEMLITIKAEKYFYSQKNFFDENELEDIENALKNNPECLNVVFCVNLPREEGKKLDNRRKLYKILSKFNTKEFSVIKSYKIQEISEWIKKRANEKEITLKNDAIELLIENIGNNLRQFDIELDKLKLLSYPKNVVTKDMIKEISISNEDLFNITELIMKNQKDRALLELKNLTGKRHPLEILSAIQTMLRKWIILKVKSNSAPSELSKLTGMHEFVIKQTLEKLRKTPVSELVKLKESLFDVEYKIKSAESLDMLSEVECALIR